MTDIINSIRNIKKRGDRVMGCYPLYPPLELIHSMGITPIVMWGLRDSVKSLSESDKHIQTYACSVARYMTEFIYQNNTLLDGIISYNACDTLRNLPEIVDCVLNNQEKKIPVFMFHAPAVSLEQTRDAGKYLNNRIKKLIHEIEATYGVSFSGDRFAASIELYRTMRNLCIDMEKQVAAGVLSFTKFCESVMSGCYMSVEEHITLLNSVHSDLNKPPEINKSKRIIISGILPPPPGISDLFEKAGLTIAGNDIASLKRSYAYTPANSGDPFIYYDDYYQNHFPCTTILYSADRRLIELKHLIDTAVADGFVFIGEKFCEYEYFEIPYIEKKMNEWGIPNLFIEISVEDRENIAQYETRIEAFAENL